MYGLLFLVLISAILARRLAQFIFGARRTSTSRSTMTSVSFSPQRTQSRLKSWTTSKSMPLLDCPFSKQSKFIINQHHRHSHRRRRAYLKAVKKWNERQSSEDQLYAEIYALASTAQATDAEQDADPVAPESREDAVQSTEPVQKRAKGSWEPKRSPKICDNCKYFCVGGGEYESKVHVRTVGRGSSGIIPAKNCPLLKDLCPYNQNPWAYLSKKKKENQRKLGLDMLTYNAKIARENAGM